MSGRSPTSSGGSGEGRKLTQTGALTLADARALVEKLGTGDLIDPEVGTTVHRTKSSTELINLSLILAWAHARAATGEDLEERDHAWLVADYAAAGLARSGPDEAMSRLYDGVPGEGAPREGLASRLDAVACAVHPVTAELAETLTAFLASGATPTVARAYQLKVSLRMKDPVWRRVLMPAASSLGDLHQLIQIVLDWDGDHLHLFTVGRRTYGDPFATPDHGDEECLRLGDAFDSETKIYYSYDFGSTWSHTIQRERVLDLAVGATYPVCIAGEGDAPVEDWTEGEEATPFDLDGINRQLSEAFGAEPEDR